MAKNAMQAFQELAADFDDMAEEKIIFAALMTQPKAKENCLLKASLYKEAAELVRKKMKEIT
jgi:hypothetical protein